MVHTTSRERYPLVTIFVVTGEKPRLTAGEDIEHIAEGEVTEAMDPSAFSRPQ